MFVDVVLIGIGFFCRTTYKDVGRTTYKEVAQTPPLPYASVVFGSNTQGPSISRANFGIGIVSCCRTTFKDVDRMAHKEVAQGPRLPYASVLFGTREHRSHLQKTPLQRHFLHHKFHTSDLGLNAGRVVSEVTDLLNHDTASV